MSRDGVKANRYQAARRGGLRRIVSEKRAEAPVPRLVGVSPAMVRIMRLAAQVAPTDSTVLITGETGVGKEVVARNIHHWSHLQGGVFLPVTCGAIPETLLEGQLFGEAEETPGEAEAGNQGLFARARGGTVFLDEIGELTPRLQVKLLRMIEDLGNFVGGAGNGAEVDVRIIAGASHDLQSAVDQGRFREDLFYRINTISVEIPPLRERREDIPPLVEYLMARDNARLQRSYRGADEETLEILKSLPLRGNVRELHHLIEYAMIVGDGEWLRPADLPPGIAPQSEAPTWGDHYASAMQRCAKAHIENVLGRSGNDRKKAAEALGMDLSTLYRKIQILGIEVPS